MAKSRHGRVVVDIAAQANVAEGIWERLEPIGNHDWVLPRNKSILEAIIGKKSTHVIYSIIDSHEQNRRMREIISRQLRNAPVEKKQKLIRWIIHDWGRITRGRRTSIEWAYELNSFSRAEIKKFIERHHKSRISSWSKVLAFADQDHDAIYDSRTSVSLNVIFDEMDVPYRFYMPQSRNIDLPPVISHVQQRVQASFRGSARNRYRTYLDYIRLLEAIKERCSVVDITEIEMRLFAHAEIFARRYAKKYGIILPEENKSKLQMMMDFKGNETRTQS